MTGFQSLYGRKKVLGTKNVKDMKILFNKLCKQRIKRNYLNKGRVEYRTLSGILHFLLLDKTC